MSSTKIGFVASETEPAGDALAALKARYGDVPPEEADVIVALGGDGFMLDTLHRFPGRGVPIYGMNQGTVGFLMNLYDEDDQQVASGGTWRRRALTPPPGAKMWLPSWW